MKSSTMKSYRIQIVSLILAGLISIPAHAEVIPGRWEKVAALETAPLIKVDLKNGDRISGQFRGLSSSDLELLNAAGRALIPRADIQTITLPAKDGLGDGALKGAAIGAGVAGGLSLIGIAFEPPGKRGDLVYQALLLTIPVCAGLGAVIGVVADAATKTEDIVVYKAPEYP